MNPAKMWTATAVWWSWSRAGERVKGGTKKRGGEWRAREIRGELAEDTVRDGRGERNLKGARLSRETDEPKLERRKRN